MTSYRHERGASDKFDFQHFSSEGARLLSAVGEDLLPRQVSPHIIRLQEFAKGQAALSWRKLRRRYS